VIQAYEKRIDKLGEQAAMKIPPKGRLEELIEHALTFLGNPWKLYENGSFAFKRTVLKLAFAEPLRYCRHKGYRTAKTTIPFKVLADISNQKCGMVEAAVFATAPESAVLQKGANSMSDGAAGDEGGGAASGALSGLRRAAARAARRL